MADKTLKLTVELVGQIDAQMQQLARQMKQVDAEMAKNAPEAAKKFFQATGQSSQGIKKLGEGTINLRRELKATGEVVGKFVPVLSGVTAAAGALAAGAGTVVASIAALGAAVGFTGKKLNEFSESMQSMRFAAQRSGISVSYMRDLQQAGAAFQLSTEEVQEGAVNFSQAMAKAKTNFQGFRNQIRQTGLLPELQPFLDAVDADPDNFEKAFQKFNEGMDKIREDLGTGPRGQLAIDKIREIFNLPANFTRASAKDWLDEIQKSRETRRGMGLTDEEIAAMDERAKQFHEDMDQTLRIFQNFGTLIASDIYPDFHKFFLDFNEVFGSPMAAKWASALAILLKGPVEFLDEIVKLFTWIDAHTPSWLKKLIEFYMRMAAAAPTPWQYPNIAKEYWGGGGGGGGGPAAPGGGGGGGRPGAGMIGPMTPFIERFFGQRSGTAAPGAPGAPAAPAPGPPISVPPGAGAGTAPGPAGPGATPIPMGTGEIPLSGGALERGTQSLTGMNPELRARFDALAELGRKEGQQVTLESGFRDPNDPRIQALYREHLAKVRAGTARRPMAVPERSQHARTTGTGGAGDVGGDVAWAIRNAHRVGLMQPMPRSDPEHLQMDPNYKGPTFAHRLENLDTARAAIDESNKQQTVTGSGKIDITVNSAEKSAKRNPRNLLRNMPLPRQRQMERSATGPSEGQTPRDLIRD
jgi:hypothetical protein